MIIIHLRDRLVTSLTGVKWLKETARKVAAPGINLILASVDASPENVAAETGVLEIIGRDNIFSAHPRIGASMSAALDAANKWIRNKKG